MQQLLQKATELATKLTANRVKQVKPLQDKVNKLLAQVGMPNARLQVEVKQLASLQATGQDDIEFLFDANKSNRFEPIRKVASGGELSRLMLCIKSLVAQSLDLPTLIFDEIDTGISGEAAKQVGVIMKDLARKRQVFSITHQPQIAGKADAHYFVYKDIKGNTIKTSIRLLTQDERITAIAKMLSGEKPTAVLLAHILLDERGALRDEKVLGEGLQALVPPELLASIIGFGRGGEDLDGEKGGAARR